jgi:hypothetical protein
LAGAREERGERTGERREERERREDRREERVAGSGREGQPCSSRPSLPVVGERQPGARLRGTTTTATRGEGEGRAKKA